jgi:Rrf2 family protein
MSRSRSTPEKASVAVHVLTYLAGVEERAVSSDELSVSTNVNPVYVRRVLGPLRDAGLVRSRPGPHGGWELTVDPRELPLSRVWQLMQGGHAVLGLHGPDPACPVGRGVQAALVALDTRVAGAITAELEQLTAHDLLLTAAPSPARPEA